MRMKIERQSNAKIFKYRKVQSGKGIIIRVLRAMRRQRIAVLSIADTKVRARAWQGLGGAELALTKPSDKRGEILSHARITGLALHSFTSIHSEMSFRKNCAATRARPAFEIPPEEWIRAGAKFGLTRPAPLYELRAAALFFFPFCLETRGKVTVTLWSGI